MLENRYTRLIVRFGGRLAVFILGDCTFYACARVSRTRELIVVDSPGSSLYNCSCMRGAEKDVRESVRLTRKLVKKTYRPC